MDDFPNLSYLNDSDIDDAEKIEGLLDYASSDYLFCCGDVFTKVWENEHEIEWGCKKSFMKISVSKNKEDWYYGEANMLPVDIDYFE
jgi:hypothetical protein